MITHPYHGAFLFQPDELKFIHSFNASIFAWHNAVYEGIQVPDFSIFQQMKVSGTLILKAVGINQ